MSAAGELFSSHTKASTLRAIHSAASNEWYTPPEIIEAARSVVGGFDIDPASCSLANGVVKATRHGGRQADGSFVDGLALAWQGTLFLNPPGPEYEPVLDARGAPVLDKEGKPKRRKIEGTGTEVWWRRLEAALERGHVGLCFYVAYSIEQVQQTQRWTPGRSFLDLSIAACFPARRLKFWKPGPDGQLVEGEQPTHASALALLGGTHNERFRLTRDFEARFRSFGAVVRP